MAQTAPLLFCDSPAIRAAAEKYMVVQVDTQKTLARWKASLYSFEWMNPDGTLKPADMLPLQERTKRGQVEESLKKGAALERPVLGIGLLDGIEIGAGRAVFLTLAALGHGAVEVHIPKTAQGDFRSLLSPSSRGAAL